MSNKSIKIPDTDKPRIVIIGGGFAGLELCRKISSKQFQLVMLDRHNYHTFQPLLYQVATAGLEPSSITGPLRKLFKSKRDYYFRLAEVEAIIPEQNTVDTNLGQLTYDFLVVANGAKTNYFGNEENYEGAYPLKQVSQALNLRNSLLRNFEKALITEDPIERKSLMTYVVVGGGPTGVEVAGALCELKNNVLPKDYPELDLGEMQVYLMEGAQRVLNGMSEKSHRDSVRALQRLGVQVKLETMVKSYKNRELELGNGEKLKAHTLIWGAGVTGNIIKGLEPYVVEGANRIAVDQYNRVEDTQNVFALGDVAIMKTEKYPKGHPQLAPVAMQQATLLARNLPDMIAGRKLKAFRYIDKGTMATIGRNRAVVDLPGQLHLKGFLAWFVWMFVHLMSIVGFRNKVVIFINWVWNYVTYDRSIRLILKARG